MAEKVKIGFVGSRKGPKYNAFYCCSAFEYAAMFNEKFDVTHISNQKEFDACCDTDVEAIISASIKRRDVERRAAVVDWSKCKCKKFCYLNDLHKAHRKRWLGDFKTAKNIVALPAYFQAFLYYNPSYTGRFVWQPHAVADSFISARPIKFAGNDKIDAIGAVSSSNIYSLRKWIAEQKNVNVIIKRQHRTKYVAYGWQKGFIDFLSKSDAVVVSSCVRAPYIVAKYFEVPASGALLFAQKTAELKYLGFEHMKNCVLFTAQNFNALAEEYISSRTDKRWLSIREAGRSLIRERHVISKRLDTLEKIILGRWDDLPEYYNPMTIQSGKRFLMSK